MKKWQEQTSKSQGNEEGGTKLVKCSHVSEIQTMI
jgi:hypothetical protein